MEDKKPHKRPLSLERFGAVLLGLFLSLSCFGITYAQEKVTGIVTEGSTGEPLVGVTIKVKGTSTGAISDLNGRFSISVPNLKSTLIFSYIGFKTQEVPLNGRRTVNIALSEDNELLSELVVVGYGTQKRASVTGSVSSIDSKELLKAPPVGITNALAGRASGVTMLQQSGRPGSDAASLLIRGEGAKFIVDGVERSINEIDPNEIASISILKDATSASVYGLNASSVVLVTTKQGREGKLDISYNGTFGISQNANQLKWLDGPAYAYYHNKATELDGGKPIFSEQMVQKMKEGKDGWGNTNWYDLVFGTGRMSTHNINATGGTEKIKYFTSLGVYDQKGNVEGFNYTRYNLRSNVDSQITKYLSMQLNIAARIDEHSAPRYSANPSEWHNIPQQAVRSAPFLPLKVVDPADGQEYYVSSPTASSPVSPIGSIHDSGYSKSRNTTLQSNFMLKYDLPWVEGLSVKFNGAYDKFFQFSKVLQIPVKTMLADFPGEKTDKIHYKPFQDAGGNTGLSESGYEATTIVTQTSVNYDHAFGKHNVGFLGLFETRDNSSHSLRASGKGLDFVELDQLDNISNSTGTGEKVEPTIGGNAGQSRVMGTVLRLNYDYDNRYLLEVSYRRDGSYLFANNSGTRWINLPAVSGGWRIDKEDWFDVSAIDMLKLRGGIGKTATSNVGAFAYLNLMKLQPKSLVLGSTLQSMMYTQTLGNPDLSWAKATNYNLGVEFSAWNGLLGLELDVFYKYQYDLIASVAGSYPPSMGGYFHSQANVNKIDYRGFDFTISHDNTIGDFQYGAKMIGTLALRRWLYYAGDSENTPDYMKVTGSEVGAKRGLTSLGLFQNEKEITNSPLVPGYKVLPGYIKYKDLNGDGKITQEQDVSFVGKSDYPRFQGSLSLYATWKGIDFNMLLLGGFGRTVALTGYYSGSGVQDNTAFTKPFYHGGNSPLFLVENSWTPEHRDADFPRLSITGISNNNGFASDFWYRNGNYVRVKSCQLGYSLPASLLDHIGVKQLRIFLDGSNLLTFSELTKYNIDPEQPGVNNGYYPQQRTISLGLNLSL